MRAFLAAAFAAFALFGAPAWSQQQGPDPDFVPHVAEPTYVGEEGPLVAIDHAHENFHTLDGRYAPFAQLLIEDGYRVGANVKPFSRDSLAGIRVLVIANATGEEHYGAFEPYEIAQLIAWVEAGGALLLIADHAPFGAAAQALSSAFGVRMGTGWAYRPEDGRAQSFLTYTPDTGLAADHPIMRGRETDPPVHTVRAFTGQSLQGPRGAEVLLRLPDDAREAPNQDALAAANRAIAAGEAPLDPGVGGAAQGLALQIGKGRVVVMGEAGMFSAQVVTFPDGSVVRFGMNVAGLDNQRFALNVVRWLAQPEAD